MGINGAVLVAALALFLTWSGMLIGAAVWFFGRFLALERAINAHVPVTDYNRAHEVLVMRVSYLERWALRLNGTVKVDFADVSDPDYRSE